MNAESAHEIAKELFALECEQRRLTYFIGLLDKRQAEVIRLVFVDGIPTKEVAASFGLTYRTIDRIKRTAIENLAEMYAYSCLLYTSWTAAFFRNTAFTYPCPPRRSISYFGIRNCGQM